MAKTDKLASDLDEHNYVADYNYGLAGGHKIGFSWSDNKLHFYVDGSIIRSW